MNDELLKVAHDMWFGNTTKWFKNLDIPYLKELKDVLWNDYVIQYIYSDKFQTAMTRSNSSDVLPEYRSDNIEFIKTSVKHLLILQERSYQIYLDPTDPLNQKETNLNGHIYIKYTTKAKREWVLNLIFDKI